MSRSVKPSRRRPVSFETVTGRGSSTITFPLSDHDEHDCPNRAGNTLTATGEPCSEALGRPVIPRPPSTKIA
ncbi:hypothetical protein QF026_006968 [Streptomyces aurantiacus]|nr:hypothetical protein [Streptomyces aurantiacus]